MRYSTHSIFPVLWGAVAILSGFVHGASVSPAGTPPAFVKPVFAIRNKTDFSSIFSDIKNHKVTPLHSGSLAARDLPPAPQFFNLVFPGPLDAANNAPGYMGYVSLPTYDVNACAEQCNTRAYQAPLGSSDGPCIYFNLWTAVVNGTPTANICSLYNTNTNSSTATNTGQGDLVVTNSLGYSRISLIQDGSFQDYTCVITQNNGCPYMPSIYWSRFYVYDYEYVLIDDFGGRSGTAAALFIFVPPTPTSPGYGSTLTYSLPLGTVAGQTYVISLFVTNSNLYPPPTDLTGPTLSVLWNGVDVLDAVQVGPETFNGLTYYNIQATVVAQGGDTFVLRNGIDFPHAIYAVDISLFQKWF